MNHMEFQVTFADVTIDVTATRPHTKEYCRAYLTQKPQSDFSIELTREVMEAERRYTYDIAVRTGRPPMGASSDDAMELQALYRKVLEGLLDYQVLMLHSSAISVDDRAYLFCAPSGTGKSTHTGNWMEMFGGEQNGRSFVINDDKPLLRFKPEGIYVYGSPWAGKGGRHQNVCVPLKAFCLLRRGKENYLKPLRPEEADALLWQDLYRPEDAEKMAKTMKLVHRLLYSVPLYRLYCTAGLESAQVAYEAMSGE